MAREQEEAEWLERARECTQESVRTGWTGEQGPGELSLLHRGRRGLQFTSRVTGRFSRKG